MVGAASEAGEAEDAAWRRADARPWFRALAAAFPLTVPILAGFAFLGFSYGVYVRALGFPPVYPLAMATVIFGGSLEFLVAGMLGGAFAPLTTFLVALAVQARHLFYGIAMLDRYRDAGWMRPFLIFGMCDETFSVLCSAEPPAGVDRRWFMFWVTLLDYLYWALSALAGGVVGGLLPFDTEGISFVMTALFAVILLERLLGEGDVVPALVGAAASVACLAAFGPDGFMLPALAASSVVLVALRGRLGLGAEKDGAPAGPSDGGVPAAGECDGR